MKAGTAGETMKVHKKVHKQQKRGLTFRVSFGILTKLSDMRQRFENTNSRKTLEKSVDKSENVWYSIKHPPESGVYLVN